MKKTLITLLALAGVAVGEDYTFTTTNASHTSVSGFWCNGVALVLDSAVADSRLTTTVSPAGADMGDFDTVGLSSITINIRDMKNSAGIKLALTDSSGKILTLSDNVVTSTGDQKWTFSNTTVSTTDTLYFVYTAVENTKVQVGYTLTTGGNGMVTIDNETKKVTDVSDLIMCGASSLAQYSSTAGVSTLAFLGSNQTRDFTLYNDVYAPCVTVVTTATIPEPATATLSLLALAGLAARRRRR